MDVAALRSLRTGPRQSAFRQGVVGGAIFVAILAVFLTQTRLPAVLAKLPALGEGASANGRSTFSQVLDPLAFPEGLRWLAYGVNLWDANAVGMFFALLLGGAAMAIAPAFGMPRLIGRRGPGAAAFGGAMGLPLFMCSACSAPVSLGFRRAGASLETTLGIILGSALFNPVGLLAILVLLPAEMGVARLAFGVLMVAAVVPAIGRLDRRGAAVPTAPPVGLLDPLATGAPAPGGWLPAARAALAAWWRATIEQAIRLVPAMAVASLAVGALLVVLPPQQLSAAVGAGVVAIVVAAALGTLLQLPTLFEIPLVIGMLALGLGPGPAAALLLAAPSAGVATFALTRSELGWRPPALLLLATFAGATAGGLLVAAL